MNIQHILNTIQAKRVHHNCIFLCVMFNISSTIVIWLVTGLSSVVKSFKSLVTMTTTTINVLNIWRMFLWLESMQGKDFQSHPPLSLELSWLVYPQTCKISQCVHTSCSNNIIFSSYFHHHHCFLAAGYTHLIDCHFLLFSHASYVDASC